jgi:hypothetical protein
LPLLLTLVLAAILITRSRGVRQTTTTSSIEPVKIAANTAPDAESGQKVPLTVDFGEGNARTIEALAWREGMTVGDLLAAASQLPGGIQVASQGTGDSTFLTAIDGVANEGASGRNWTYSVNGQRGDRSYAVFDLRPGDHVLWTFAGRK